ncbi:uncharacterized protein LOC126899387 [Daktulosphaira vitifoliae]|uniref:uncharacterized protein LOC126899387 n=1 Tax=Daktulosphaira vitifoliae TaxID=58002 RepID=UPI0021AA0774|nr:uncharacterized protein LOC126899387 [Daktulosphaira vitifoliae]
MAAAAAAGTTATSPSSLSSDVKVHQENEQEQRLKNNSSRSSSSRSSSSSSSGGIPSPKSVTSGGNGSVESEYSETKRVPSNSGLPKTVESTTNNTDTIGGRLTFYKDGKFIFELAHQRMCGIDETCRWIPVKHSKTHQQVQQRYNSDNKKSWPGILTNSKEGLASDDISTVLPNSMFKQHVFKIKRQRKMKIPNRQINCHMEFLMKARKKFKLLRIIRSHIGRKRKFNYVIKEDFCKNKEKTNGLIEEKTVQLGNIGQKKIKKKAQPLYAVVHALWELVVLKESKHQNNGDTSLDCRPFIAANMSPRKHRLLSNNTDDWVQNKQPLASSPPVDFSPNSKKYCRRNVSSPAAASTPSVINGLSSKDDHKVKANNHSINAILASTPINVPHISNNDLALTDEPIISNPQGLSLLRTLLRSPGPNTNGSTSVVSNTMPERLSPHNKQRHKVFSPPIIQSPKRQMYHQTVENLLKHSKDGIPETNNLDSIRNIILMDQRLHHPNFNSLTVTSNNLHHPSLFHPQYHLQQPTPAHLSVPRTSSWSPSHLFGTSLSPNYPNMMLLPSSHHHSSTPSSLQQSPHSPLIVAPYSPCSPITSSTSVSSSLFSSPSYHQQPRHHRVVSPSNLLFNQHHKHTSNSNLSSATVDIAGTSDDIDVPLNLSKNCSTSSAARY